MCDMTQDEQRGKLIDAPLIQVPLESLKQTCRERKVAIDAVNRVHDEIAKAGPSDCRRAIDDAIACLEKAKTRLEEIKRAESEDMRRCRARLTHLRNLGDCPREGTIAWNRRRMDVILADYMLRSGYLESAQALASDRDMEDLVDLRLFSVAHSVARQLEARDCRAALEFCAQNRARLKKNNSRLEFRLRVQEFVELVRKGESKQAIKYAQKYMAPWAKDNMAEFKRAVAAMAFGPGTPCKRYRDLFSDEAWPRLRNLFLLDFYLLHSLPPVSLLQIHLEAGLSALKTPESFQPGCSKEDPLHLPAFQKLAQDLPWSKHVHSKLVCALTHEVMDVDNPPLVLPNGRVYSTKAVQLIAARNDGNMVCPETEQVFPATEAKRLYIV